MNVNDLIADIGRSVQAKRDIVDTLKRHGHDPEQSARVSFALMEIGLEGFRQSGMGPFLAMALIQMIAHGATMERALKAVMLIQEEDDLKDEIDPRRKDVRATQTTANPFDSDQSEDPPKKKRTVM